MPTKNTSIRLDPKIKGLLDRIPEGFDKDFTDEQLMGLNIALGKRSWRDHPIDFRHSIGLLKKLTTTYFNFSPLNPPQQGMALRTVFFHT